MAKAASGDVAGSTKNADSDDALDQDIEDIDALEASDEEDEDGESSESMLFVEPDEPEETDEITAVVEVADTPASPLDDEEGGTVNLAAVVVPDAAFDDDVLPAVEDGVVEVLPQQADEFRCGSCFLVLHERLRARADRDVCRDCD